MSSGEFPVIIPSPFHLYGPGKGTASSGVRLVTSHRRKVYLAACMTAASFASAHAGSVVRIDPFEGDYSEGFESIQPGDIPSPQYNQRGPLSIFDNHASLSFYHTINASPGGIWSTIGGFSLDDKPGHLDHVTAIPFDGLKGFYLASVLEFNATALIEFDTPVTEFGGYWVHAVTQTQGGPITIAFLDGGNEVIGADQFSYDYENLRGVSQWFGWSSAVAIHAVTFTGFFAGIDGIQVNVVPEPGQLLLLTLASFSVLLRRR